MIDFIKEGEVGDKVKCALHGEGVIMELIPEAGEGFPLILLIGGDTYRYTRHGQYYNGVNNTVCFGNGSIVIDQGSPPERFVYPLYAYNGDYIVQFTGITEGTVVDNYNGVFSVGYHDNSWIEHTNASIWTHCDEPKWKPDKPTWCWVWNEDKEDKHLKLVIRWSAHPSFNPTKLDYNYKIYSHSSSTDMYRFAEPCVEGDIPRLVAEGMAMNTEQKIKVNMMAAKMMDHQLHEFDDGSFKVVQSDSAHHLTTRDFDIFNRATDTLSIVKYLGEREDTLIFFECYGSAVAKQGNRWRYDSNAYGTPSDWYASLEEAVAAAVVEVMK